MSEETLDETPKRKPFQRLMGAYNEIARVMADLGYNDSQDAEALERAVRSAPRFMLETITGRWSDVQENVIKAMTGPIQSGSGMVVVSDMRSLLVCPHHFTAAEVRCDLAFVQDSKTVGVGSIHEVFEQLCRQPVLMERLAAQIATLFGPEIEDTAEYDKADKVLRGLLQELDSRGPRMSTAGCMVRLSGSMICACKPGRQHRASAKFVVQETNGVFRSAAVISEASALLGRAV